MRRNRMRSMRLRSARGCFATSPRSMPRSRPFGRKLRCRWCMAPVGALEIFDAGPAAAGGSGAAHRRWRLPYAELGVGAWPGEDRGGCAQCAALILQLYVRGDERFVEDMREPRASQTAMPHSASPLTPRITAGASAISPSAMSAKATSSATGGDFQKGLEWRTVKLIRDKFKIPLDPKGIAYRAKIPAIALDHGVDWIYVSNHGGRQLDHGRGAGTSCPR